MLQYQILIPNPNLNEHEEFSPSPVTWLSRRPSTFPSLVLKSKQACTTVVLMNVTRLASGPMVDSPHSVIGLMLHHTGLRGRNLEHGWTVPLVATCTGVE